MKTIKTILICLSFINISWAHKDFYVTQTFGQVTVRFHTGFHYEEIQKAYIIGQYCDLYLKYYNKSNEKVVLDFHHDYTGSLTPNYFINYSRGESLIKYNEYQSFSEEPFSEEKTIIIKQIENKFDLYKTLKLVKYSVNNLNKIKTEQKKTVYKCFFEWFEQESIDTLITKNIVNEPINSEFENLTSLRVYRHNYQGINYFMSGGQFYVCFQNKVLSCLKEIDSFYQISLNEALVFTSKSEFYYLKYDFNNGIKQKKRQLEKTKNKSFEPLTIRNLGNGRIEIVDIDDMKDNIYSYNYLKNILTITKTLDDSEQKTFILRH